MNTLIKSKIPFLFLISISIWWAFYYQSNSKLNDFGNANFEWLYLLDALIVLPLVCFFCVKSKKDALLKSIILVSLAILTGSYIIPEQNKLVWHYLENGRLLVVALFFVFEIVAISTVYLAIKSALIHKHDPDLAIEKPIKRLLGEGPVAQLFNFETRMWTYALFSQRVNHENFNGEQHFTYHHKDVAQSNLLGFVLLIAFEMPIMHLLLHFIWSPLGANIVTLLTVFSLVFFYAEYRAVSRRPISLVGDTLIIRYGIYRPLKISLANIENISKSDAFIKRSRFVKRYNYSGTPNIKIALVKADGNVKNIYLGVDSAESFITAVKDAKTRYNNAV